MSRGRVVADQFNIPTVYDSWQELLEDESINAVCIGTWPYMHRTLTIAALEAGKHVLTEARMACQRRRGPPDAGGVPGAPRPGDADCPVSPDLPGGQPALPDDRRGLRGRRAGRVPPVLHAQLRRHRRRRCTGATTAT